MTEGRIPDGSPYSDDEAREIKQLQHARLESIGSTSGAIGHKLNNLLAGLLGYVTLLRRASETGKDPDAIGRYLDALDVTGGRVSELTKHLMTIAHRDKVQSASHVGTWAIVAEVAAASEREVTVGEGISDDSDGVVGDAEMLRHIVEQLIDGVAEVLPDVSAISASGARGAVDDTVAVDLGMEPGSCVILAFEHEHGPVETITRERLFDPYYTIESKGRGAEFHLTEAWGEVCLHSGAIAVVPDGDSRTRVLLYLPVDRSA